MRYVFQDDPNWASCAGSVHNTAMRTQQLTVYTVGYEGMTIDSFVALLRAQRIVHLVDIREVALSRKKGFSKTALSAKLEAARIRYSHVRDLGCPKPIRDRYRADGNWDRYVRSFCAYLESQTVALGALERTLKEGRTSIMCFEADYTRCHRSLVADRLGGAVVHLTASGTVNEVAAGVA
jgi:uncharacterized protein (DUF488 family)